MTGELPVGKPGELSRFLSMTAAGQQYDYYRLVRLLSRDPILDSGRCQYCSSESFATDAFTKYDRWRPRWHEFDLPGFLLDALGLVSGGAGDDIAKVLGRQGADLFNRGLSTIDVGYGASQFADKAAAADVSAVDTVGLTVDIAGIFGGPALDAIGIGLNVWNVIEYYGP